MVFSNYEEAEKHLALHSLSKRQLCSLMHSFHNPCHTLIPQTIIFSRFTWRQLHESVNPDWDVKIPESTQEWTKVTLYSFFLESSLDLPIYIFCNTQNVSIFYWFSAIDTQPYNLKKWFELEKGKNQVGFYE